MNQNMYRQRNYDPHGGVEGSNLLQSNQLLAKRVQQFKPDSFDDESPRRTFKKIREQDPQLPNDKSIQNRKLCLDYGESRFDNLQRQLEDLSIEEGRRSSNTGSYHPKPPSLTVVTGVPLPEQPRDQHHRHSRYSPLIIFRRGIIHHPSESTDNYTILRHSHGLVFYQGTTTSVAVSVFSGNPLTTNGTYWLKPKNWATTAKSRATFRQQANKLLNVTPAEAVKAERIDLSDERAWQRDITEFQQRTREGRCSTHILRETVAARIPTEAGDGYFQLVLSAGEDADSLCISPSLWILSISPNMGGVSGAHWATLPFEVCAIALSIQPRTAAGTALLPVKTAAKSKTKSRMPSKVTSHATEAKLAGKLAYGAAGAADKVGAQIKAFNSRYNEERGGPFTPAFNIEDGYENGPKYSYPIRFQGRYDYQDNLEVAHIMPTIKLTDVPELATYRLSGYYFGWCTGLAEKLDRNGKRKMDHHWFQAVIIVISVDINKLDGVTMLRANRKHVRIQILDEAEEKLDPDTVLDIEVLGCLRPWDQELERILAADLRAGEELVFETTITKEMNDIKLTQEILEDPSWGSDLIAKERAAKEEKPKVHGFDSAKEEYADVRLKLQQKLDHVPLHKIGVRCRSII
ncbi:hypothetical protein B0O99DRAFT_748541 [Bisporella sp. PMI_857]|nr:hypothetical protein B0O99DRAFT_748541 [Bisporella sp. PMI_857]